MLWERNIAVLKCGEINARAETDDSNRKRSTVAKQKKVRFFGGTKQDQLTWVNCPKK
jgi:hypothetical protein